DKPVSIKRNYICNNSRAGISITDNLPLDAVVTITENDIGYNNLPGIVTWNDCTVEITKNKIHDNIRSGIATHFPHQSASALGAVMTIRQNKIYNNGGDNVTLTGGGIAVTGASGTIENNLIYDNHAAGIRFSDWMEVIVNNTVVNNGNDHLTPEDPSDDRGGGIIYDDVADGLIGPPSGMPPGPLTIKNNICAYNKRAGIRACFDNTLRDRDYNLLYSNNQDWLSYSCGLCASPDCSTGDRRDLRKCIGAQLGRRTYDLSFTCSLLGATGAVPGETLLFADPKFEDVDGNPYHLAPDSPAIIDGYGEIGAYGGEYPINDNDFFPYNLVDCLIDGDTSTGNHPSGGEDLYFDLGGPYTVKHVRLYGSDENTNTWRVMVHSDFNCGTGGHVDGLVLNGWEVGGDGSRWYQGDVDDSVGSYIGLWAISAVSQGINEHSIFEFQFSTEDTPTTEGDWLTPVRIVGGLCTDITGKCVQ
ncbi:MAG: right-handed parallel beta-helix repeat-containing protein, partial [Deltaproteobacteria bacterium]|nr:right-handed parallel beta-helix repeat-containing protein [Deltaproteobacteria bacterium]